MGKWRKGQMFVGDKRRFTVFEVTREGERPGGKLAVGASFIKVFKGKSGKWRYTVPKYIQATGLVRVSAPKGPTWKKKMKSLRKMI